ncbi:MAG: hypothetical protein JNJ61_19250 [Anaerolineae bacterium]|nr:hypothetical protein [Anaerolineae bacterium]
MKHRQSTRGVKLCFAAILFLLYTFSLAADIPNQDHVLLASPTAASYLATVVDVLARKSRDDYGLPSIIDAEFSLRYSDPLLPTYRDLRAAYLAINKASIPYFEHQARWEQWLLLNWIEENTINLDAFSQFATDDEVIRVTTRDFDTDGQNEWILEIPDSQVVVLRREGTAYRLVETPLPFFRPDAHYVSIASGFMEEILFEDLTGDGLPEWVLAVGGYGANGLNGGHLLVLHWKNGRLVDIAPQGDGREQMRYDAPGGAAGPLFPNGVTISFTNEDGNGTQEVIIQQRQGDNWGCTWLLRRVFAWDGHAYSLQSRERFDNEVAGCEIRAAETALWSGDYDAAIVHYERAFTMPFAGEEVSIVPTESVLLPYAKTRLALAYTLTGQGESAASVIAEVAGVTDYPPVLTQFIWAIADNLGSALATCRAAYNSFAFECSPGTDTCVGSPLDVIVGTTLESFGEAPNSRHLSFPSPLQAGCDMGLMLRDQLAADPLRLDTSAPEQLAVIGFSIQESWNFDLNGDQHDEWLIKFELPIPALFLHTVSGGATYHDVFLSTSVDQIYVRNSPIGDEQVFVTTARNPGLNCPSARPGEDGSHWGPPHVATVWRLDSDSLRAAQHIPFCAPNELAAWLGTFEQHLPDAFVSWYEVPGLEYLAQAVYQWDDQQQRYVVTNIQPIRGKATNYALEPGETLWDALEQMREGNDQHALSIVEQGLRGQKVDKNTRTAMLYLRGLSLELLNRDAEAFAQYDEIYAAAPESAWGVLAALHLS